MAQADTTLTDLVKTGYDTLINYPLRYEMYFALSAATRKVPMNITNPGTTITETFVTDLAAATATLTEGTDVTPVAPSTSVVSVTLNEYGNTMQSTAKLRGSTFVLPQVDPILANLIGYNAALSYDTLARTALVGGTNVIYPGTLTARNQVSNTNTMSAAITRKTVAKLRGGNARGFGDMGVDSTAYAGFIHPDVSVDLRSETGVDSWTQPANYSDATRRWNGRLGVFEGTMFIETPRAPIFVGAGSASHDVYATIFVGREALLVAWSASESALAPQTVIGPVVDSLRRFHTVGWYWFGGFALFRQPELFRVETGSSIGN